VVNIRKQTSENKGGDSVASKMPLTPQQWAWQFLRLNHSYKAAYAQMVALTKNQSEFLLSLSYGLVFDYADHMRIVKSLPVCIFERRYMPRLQDKHNTVGEYLEYQFELFEGSRKEYLEAWGDPIDRLHLVVNNQHRLTTYGLRHWLDPCIESLARDEAVQLWQIEVPVHFALERMPSLDHIARRDVSVANVCGASKRTKTKVTSVVASLFPRNAPELLTRVLQEPLPDAFVKRGAKNKAFIDNRVAQRVISGIESVAPKTQLAKVDPFELESDTTARVDFDLSLPIDYQLTKIKAALEAKQKELLKAEFVLALPKQADRNNVYSKYVRVLHMLDEGKNALDMAIEFKGLTQRTYPGTNKPIRGAYFDPKQPDRETSTEHTDEERHYIVRAKYLRDTGYRALALHSYHAKIKKASNRRKPKSADTA
jgi:hypothetical protein